MTKLWVGGGTSIRAIKEEHQVFWLNMTSAKGNPRFSVSMIEKRDCQLRDIERFYGFTGVYHLNLPTTELDRVNSADAIEQISKVFKEVKPETVILPDYNDAHSDHKYVFDWCYACTKVFRFPSIKQVMTMEIISETDFGSPKNPFVPNCFIDISDYMDDKIEALKIYDTELGIHPFPRSIENVKALATVRGVAAGVKYAEAFKMIKMVI
jgi:LmbE family N-acetylglucosaminyl deacetylase